MFKRIIVCRDLASCVITNYVSHRAGMQSIPCPHLVTNKHQEQDSTKDSDIFAISDLQGHLRRKTTKCEQNSGYMEPRELSWITTGWLFVFIYRTDEITEFHIRL